jgi:hypothetical protein
MACPFNANQTASCTNSVCSVQCTAGYADCNAIASDGCEVALNTDPNNCGACNRPCSLPNAVPGCIAGVCVVKSCQAGYGNCDGVNFNGCEKSTLADPANCGTCGHICTAAPNATVACSGGACLLASCTGNFADCDGQYNNGCESNRTSDASNCSACGNVCPSPPNASPVCMASTCGIGACYAGWGNCDGNAANGCEQDLVSSLLNCGSCGRACAAVANGSYACVSSACTITGCNGGFADCNRTYGDGCEVNLQTNVSNCGACGLTCSFANGTGACSGGNCVLMSCSAGYASCDGNDANGCEANTGTDRNNCGSCGTVCPVATPICNGGMCTNMQTLVGSYTLGMGPAYATNPPTRTCQDACALVYGGTAAQYSCSTSATSVNHLAWVDCYANSTHCQAGGTAMPENYKVGTNYNCGVANCACSAYVTDNCGTATNYCYR